MKVNKYINEQHRALMRLCVTIGTSIMEMQEIVKGDGALEKELCAVARSLKIFSGIMATRMTQNGND